MNKVVLCMAIVYNCTTQAYTQHYCYNTPDSLKVTVNADTECEGAKAAARVCYKALSHDKYPGEEAGLAIIDICANPIKCKD